jgi:hypothetical protein
MAGINKYRAQAGLAMHMDFQNARSFCKALGRDCGDDKLFRQGSGSAHGLYINTLDSARLSAAWVNQTRIQSTQQTLSFQTKHGFNSSLVPFELGSFSLLDAPDERSRHRCQLVSTQHEAPKWIFKRRL